MKLEGISQKKDRLTLTQLAGYDDILTDALVDHVYFWTTIRKNRSKYNLTRGISQDDITRILLHEVIVAKDGTKAEESLLQIPGLRKFNDKLKSDREKRDFRRHMRKYINIWMTDCPFEVSTTNRYTIVTHEAAITARRTIKKNETIKYLCGTMVAMTPEEEADLDFGRQDFSIVTSTRKKTPSLFLGPARFANHDCNANARLVSQGSGGMEVVAVREISQGEEITVSYGESYFGEDNRDCLCLSCEQMGRNGWPAHEQSRIASGTSTPQDIEPSGHYSLRSSRADASRSGPGSASMTPDFTELSPRKRRKTSSASVLTPVQIATPHNPPAASLRKSARAKSSLRNELVPVTKIKGSLRPSGRSQATLGKSPNQQADDVPVKQEDEKPEDELLASVKAAFAKAKDHNKRKRTFHEISQAGPSEAEAAIPTVTAQSIGPQTLPMINIPETPRTPSNPILIAPTAISDHQSSVTTSERTSPHSAPPNSTPATMFSISDTLDPPKLSLSIADDSDSDLSDLSPSAILDDATRSIIHRTPPPQSSDPSPTKLSPRSYNNLDFNPFPTLKMLTPESFIDAATLIPTIEIAPTAITTIPTNAIPPSTRTPGDYIRTSLLLGEKYSRWVDCRTCNNTWVQANSYLTRKECPRCERHSMLYGYRWPKTMKTDEGDEERVMDHRTVHRFLTTEEEKAVRKKGRGLVKITEDDAIEGIKGGGEDDEEQTNEPPALERTRRGKRKAIVDDYEYNEDEELEEPARKRARKGKGKAKTEQQDESFEQDIDEGSQAHSLPRLRNQRPKKKAEMPKRKARMAKVKTEPTDKGIAKGKAKAKAKVADVEIVKKRRGRPPKALTT